ncbi:TPA: D-tyrosyl-tRNA(Tyr) deacylase [Candidatus Bathyarchaeota archaeon]|nr:D-tyrosyl-tRNA(Tyr) deacylase [Candidatus Bathyarchaeota archaeon]
MILIVASKEDVAAINIASHLLADHDFQESAKTFHESPTYIKKTPNGEEILLIFIRGPAIEAQFLTQYFKPRLIIFVSRHKSASGIPTLSAHVPGNLGSAEMGGLPRKVSIASASAMKEALEELMRSKERLNLNYDVSYECTHHGPSLDVPTMFVELGSSLNQWKDLKAAEAVAKAAMAAALSENVYPTVLGIGGLHYNRKFTKIAINSEIAFGHMIPKYAVHLVDSYVLRHCIERTVEPVQKIVLDWKGIKGSEKSRLMEVLTEIDLPVEKV